MPAPHFFATAPQALGIDPAKLDALVVRAEQEVRDGLLPSAQLAVACGGRLVAMRTVGRVRHGGREAPATNDTLYAVFSCTKAITSAAAWVLLEEGRLRIDERVVDIIPEFGTYGKEVVTVEQLFTHTAGFPSAPFALLDWYDPARRVQRFATWRLNWEPGSRFEYHPTSTMWVLAHIIECRSGVPYQQFVRTRIAQPLGLDDLYVGVPRALHDRVADIIHVGDRPTVEELRARGFPNLADGEVAETVLQAFNLPEMREVPVPGGGGVTTAGDLALFYQALLAGGRTYDGRAIWQAETIQMAREVRSGVLTDPIFRKRANRALGVIIAGDADRTYRGFGHTASPAAFGHNGAGGQIAWADPDTGISFAYCTNGFDRDPVRQARRGVALSSLAAALRR